LLLGKNSRRFSGGLMEALKGNGHECLCRMLEWSTVGRQGREGGREKACQCALQGTTTIGQSELGGLLDLGLRGQKGNAREGRSLLTDQKGNSIGGEPNQLTGESRHGDLSGRCEKKGCSKVAGPAREGQKLLHF